MKLIYLSILLVLSISLSTALSVDIPLPVNYSEKNVNNSQYFQGYTPTTLGSWLESTLNDITIVASNINIIQR